jgi:hypothetical protein
LDKPSGARQKQATIEELRAELEREKVASSIEWLRLATRFMHFDADFNDRILKLMDAVIEVARQNPEAVLGPGRGNLDEAVESLRKALGDRGAGVEGGDVAGGDWVDYLERIVRALSGVVKDEKDFFLAIIKLIRCGC